MATISRTGIAGGSTISPTHITNIIDALDGTSATTTVVASGSFSGSLTGHATSATTATSATSASYALSASYAANVPSTSSYALTALSASYAVTASYALNAGGGASFPYTGSAIISGSLLVTGSLNVSGPARVVGTTTVTGSVNIDQTAGGKATTLNGTINGNASLVLDLADIGKSPGTGQFILPTFVPGSPAEGTIYWSPAAKTLNVWSEGLGAWVVINS